MAEVETIRSTKEFAQDVAAACKSIWDVIETSRKETGSSPPKQTVLALMAKAAIQYNVRYKHLELITGLSWKHYK
jgi:hypothetical protein